MKEVLTILILVFAVFVCGMFVANNERREQAALVEIQGALAVSKTSSCYNSKVLAHLVRAERELVK